MKKDLFKRIIVDFQARKLEEVEERNILIPLDLRKVVSLIGVRRSGKTYVLYSLINRLRKKLDTQNVVYVNFEDDRLFPLTPGDLQDFLESYYELYPEKKKETVYFFLDEIQNAPQWEKFLRRILDTEKCRVFITGSSSKLLSKEVSTALRGRTIAFEIFPLSFEEFLRFKKIKTDTLSSYYIAKIKNAFNEFALRGGFPETVDLPEDLFIRTLREYLDLILYRDVVERYHVSNTHLLKFLVKYCLTNFATAVSFNKLYNDLRSQGFQISKNTVYEYLSCLEDAYAIFTVPLFASSVRETLRNPRKLYSIDTGFKQIVDISSSGDIGRIYENIVFLELRRRIREIHYFKGKQEVDFCYTEKGTRHLINVCYDLSRPATRERELSALSEAMRFFRIREALLLTSEEEESLKQDAETIQILPLWKWLLAQS